MLRLTVRDRILLYLLENHVEADAAICPAALTQEGIAEQAGFARRRFRTFAGPLIQSGHVSERWARVPGARQPRRVYLLTPSGRTAAREVQATLKATVIPVRDEAHPRAAASTDS